MKSIFRIVALLCLLSACAFGTVTVSGTIQDPSGAVVPNSFVRFALVNTGNNQCSANGVSLGAFSTDFYANLSTGAVSGTLYRTDTEISCGGFFTARYNMTIYRKGVPSGPTKCVLVNSDFNVATPIWCTSQPGAPALPAPQFAQTNPVTSQTVVQPLGSKFTVQGDQSVTGNVTAATGTFTGTVTGATGAFTTLTATSVNGEENAAAWPGLDILDSCQAAVTFLQANGGGIVHIPAGNYLNVTHTCTVTKPTVSIVGAGSASTFINYTGTGDAFRFQISPFTVQQAGKISGVTINGTSSGVSGVHFGDIIGFALDDVVVNAFTGASGACLWADNQTNFTERIVGTRVHANGCTKGLRFTNTLNTSASSSFDYWVFPSLLININAGQIGLSVEGGYLDGDYFGGIVNLTSATGTVFKTSGSQYSGGAGTQVNRATLNIKGECTGCSGGTNFNVGTGTSVIYFGASDVATTSDTISGVLYPIANGYDSASAYSYTNGKNVVASSTAGSIGSVLIPFTGAAGFLYGFGGNVSFDGTNWIVRGDGAHNGGWAILGSEAGSQAMSFYFFPDTGGTDQTIAPASLSTYLKASVDQSGNLHGNQLVSASATGTPPAVAASTTVVPNWNAELHNGKKLLTFTATLSPALVAANTCTPQALTVTGLAAGDIVINSSPKPTEQVGLSLPSARVTGPNTVNQLFCNNTAVGITPTASETYTYVVLR